MNQLKNQFTAPFSDDIRQSYEELEFGPDCTDEEVKKKVAQIEKKKQLNELWLEIKDEVEEYISEVMFKEDDFLEQLMLGHANVSDSKFSYGYQVGDRRRIDGVLTETNINLGNPSAEAISRLNKRGSMRKNRERYNHFFRNPQQRWGRFVLKSEGIVSPEQTRVKEELLELETRILGMQKVAKRERSSLIEFNWRLNDLSKLKELSSEFLNDEEVGKEIERLLYCIERAGDFIHYHNKYMEREIPVIKKRIRELKSKEASIKSNKKGKRKDKDVSRDEDWYYKKSMPVKSYPIILNCLNDSSMDSFEDDVDAENVLLGENAIPKVLCIYSSDGAVYHVIPERELKTQIENSTLKERQTEFVHTEDEAFIHVLFSEDEQIFPKVEETHPNLHQIESVLDFGPQDGVYKFYTSINTMMISKEVIPQLMRVTETPGIVHPENPHLGRWTPYAVQWELTALNSPYVINK